MSGLRPELEAFAVAMEAKLKDNDHKPHWEDESVSHLFDRLLEEIDELEYACNNDGDMATEAVDVANFAMMIYDKGK